ncbi:MAG: ABC transporter substrate-binding protein [Proteobacteria bacterium]|nr:ABC transporter substrate-binding protein [Pseudomonadota bacterium]MBI3496976.1 ABC transporter substrate-binding protein [Pseudomonadota bacterium]
MKLERCLRLGAALALFGGNVLAAPALAATAIDVALYGEPPNLDPVIFTSDSATIITHHIFEALYTFNSKWELQPVLASGPATIAGNGTVVTIPLRADVVFHNGRRMTAEDVVASLQRWARVSPRGKLVGALAESITMKDPSTVEIRMKQAFAPLLPLLATNTAAAVILPKELNATDTPITEFIGTGPYKFLERKPDQFTRVVRFDQYKSPPGTPDGYAGERKAIIDEIRFIPVTNAMTRVAGVISGQYAFADTLPNESYAQLKAARGVTPILVRPDWVIFMVLNTKAGPTANVKIRQAMQAAISPRDMLAAAFGDPALFDLDGSIYGKGAAYHDGANTQGFNQHDPKKAARLLKEAGYKGEPIRLLTSQQFDYFYKQTLVAKENLEEAGFAVDVKVLDWASVTQLRTNPNNWEGFIAYNGFQPDPNAVTFISPDYPGWWDTPEKTAALNEFNREMDPAKRVPLWSKIQTLLYEQASTLITGHFYSLTAVSDKLQGFTSMPQPAFWNVRLAP